MGETDDRHLTLQVSNDAVIVLLTDPKAGGMLIVSDVMGQTICTIAVQDGQTSYELPAELLYPGAVYVVKYVDTDKMKRKQRFAKFVF